MNINTFLTCLGYYGVSTGTSAILEGVYSPSSGTTGYLYNQLYATGLHQTGSLIYAPTNPLINVGRLSVSSPTFSGNHCLRAGYKHSGNFGVLMDIEYSGCSRVASEKFYTLLSTAETKEGLNSGFCVGINDANRLVFKTLNKNQTLNQELTTHDMVYVSLTESQYVTLGVFSIAENKMFSTTVALNTPSLTTDSLYIGSMLTSADKFTGYFGKINSIMLFNDDVAAVDVGTCSTCSLTTGFSTTSIVNSFSGYQITGFYYSGTQVSGATGINTFTGQIKRADGTSTPVIYSSSLSGVVSTGEIALPMLGNVSLQITGSGYSFSFDPTVINSFVRSSLTFDIPFSSGDIIEVYTYSGYNPSIGKLIYNNEWPNETGVVQLIGNGLNETSGIDFMLDHVNISGFSENDILSYDVISGAQVVTAYSGFWYGGRTLMSGGSYFPTTAQYYENTGAAFSGQVQITTLNSICTGNVFYPSFGYDLHLNGQKLVSGLQYNISTSGVSGFVVSLSGVNLPYLSVNYLYHPTGGLPTGVDSYDDNELTFIPQFSGFSRTRFDMTGTAYMLAFITGFSEQVWVNGIRQLRGNDYVLTKPCSFTQPFIAQPSFPYTMYDSLIDDGSKWHPN